MGAYAPGRPELSTSESRMTGFWWRTRTRIQGAVRTWRHILFYLFWLLVHVFLTIIARPCVRILIRGADYIWVRWPWPSTRKRAIRMLKATVRGISPRAADHYLSTLACPRRYVGIGAPCIDTSCASDCETPLLPLHSVSFNGCAWMLPFHIGVCTVLKAEGAVDASTKWLGSSGGALVAATAALGLDLDAQLRACVQMGTESSALHALGPFGLMSGYIGPQVLRSLPDNAHELARDRLYISVTEAPMNGAMYGNRLVHNVSSRRELYHALMASCYIPLYYEKPARPVSFFGAFRFDGGFSDNQPVLKDKQGRVLTTTVSPTPLAADISPGRMSVPNIEHLFPKGPKHAMAVYDSGVAVARRYVKMLRDAQAMHNLNRKLRKSRAAKGIK